MAILNYITSILVLINILYAPLIDNSVVTKLVTSNNPKIDKLTFFEGKQINISTVALKEKNDLLIAQEIEKNKAELKRKEAIVKVVVEPAKVGTTQSNNYYIERIEYWCGVYNIDCNRVKRIAKCESGFNPNAYNKSSGASGIFQQLAVYWPKRAEKYGAAGASPFDGEANIKVSLGMMRDGMWSHWECK